MKKVGGSEAVERVAVVSYRSVILTAMSLLLGLRCSVFSSEQGAERDATGNALSSFEQAGPCNTAAVHARPFSL